MSIQDTVIADQAAVVAAQAALDAANAQLEQAQMQLNAIQPHLSILARLEEVAHRYAGEAEAEIVTLVNEGRALLG